MKAIIIPAIALFLSFKNYSASAAQLFDASNQEKIEANISKTDQNRITTTNDRIAQVYATNDKFHYDIDETQGQIFIKPKSLSNESFTISIVTEKGKTIDLKLIPDDIEAETILINLLDDPFPEEVEFINDEEEFELAAIINSALIAKDIDGFVKVELTSQDPDKELKGFYETLKYKDNKRTVRVYSYKNLKSHKDTISEKQFYLDKKVQAVLIDKRVLEPNEITKIVIVENE
jgi:hypothetical protein